MRLLAVLFNAVSGAIVLTQQEVTAPTFAPAGPSLVEWRERQRQKRWQVAYFESFGRSTLTALFSRSADGPDSPLVEDELVLLSDLCSTPTLGLQAFTEQAGVASCSDLVRVKSPDVLRAVMCGLGTAATCSAILPPNAITRPDGEGLAITDDQHNLTRACGIAYSDLYMRRVENVIADILSFTPDFFTPAELAAVRSVADAFPLMERARSALERDEIMCTVMTHLTLRHL